MKKILPIATVLLLTGIMMIVVTYTTVLIFWPIPAPDEETATRQEKNLKKLKKANTGDLVVCRDITNRLDKMAVLVQHNTGAELSGRQYKKEFTGINDKIPYGDFEDCGVLVLRSKETPYSLVVGDIILGVAHLILKRP